MDRRLNNIIIEKKGEAQKYTPVSNGGGKGNFPIRQSRVNHGQYIESQFTAAWARAEKEYKDRKAVSATVRDGVYLEIKGQSGYDLLTKSLEDTRQKVRLLNIKKDDNETVIATVFVPNVKKDFFLKKINQYTGTNNKAEVISTIENINEAFVEALWIGEKKSIPIKNPIWCEIWLHYDSNEDSKLVVEDFLSLCKKENIIYKDQKIIFPERIVVAVKVNISDLATLQLSCSRIAEIRKMPVAVSFFKDLPAWEQREWMKDLSDRMNVSERSNTSICILDTGVNNGHPLLEKVLKDDDRQAVESYMGAEDRNGHGTNMAGIATFFNLEEKLEGMDTIDIYHFLESVKIMNRSMDNEPELYGDITARAISLAEIQNPDTNRSICMAVTADTDINKDGRPTSWSGAIDSLISGVDYNDAHRLMFISAGNTTINEIEETGDYEAAIRNHAIEDPGQAWNAVTVGAYTEKVSIQDSSYEGFRALADRGGISPFTSSSVTWDKKWPIKPEIVLEGGNLAYNEIEGYSEAEDLQLLTTSHNMLIGKPFTTISMTSSATAQAAWISANIQHYYPKLWPETIRALIIHSADWTTNMKEKILGKKPNKNDYRNLLRLCGYGVPNIDKAIWCASNSVNLIIEDELQPFVKKKNSSITSNEMHIHELPWPSDILLNLEDKPVRMKITLSYYIEPGPGEKGWKDKYRYPSCGLLFDVNNPTEDKNNFLKRISKAMRDDEEDKNEVPNDSSRWILGANNRNVGSIHSDIWEGTASQLSESNMIIVYPTGGWWKTRTNLRRYNSKVRYSLVVTIETPENDVDLYTAIKTKINSKVIIKTEVTAIKADKKAKR